jgi:hypothetical protein
LNSDKQEPAPFLNLGTRAKQQKRLASGVIPLRDMTRLCLILAFLASLAVVAPLRAETVSFPKKDPVFTFEIPKDWKASFTKDNALMLFAHPQSGMLIVQEMPADAVHDKESAEKYLLADLKKESMSVGINDLECSSEAYPASKGVAQLSANCSGKKYAGDIKVAAENFSAGFIVDGKRFFLMKAFGNSAGSAETMLPVLASIKAIK